MRSAGRNANTVAARTIGKLLIQASRMRGLERRILEHCKEKQSTSEKVPFNITHTG